MTLVSLVLIAMTLQRFHNRRDALAAADARRREAVLLAAPPQLVRQRQQQPRAAHAERMAERDRAAVDVDLVAIEAELLLDREVLPGERFVDLDQIEVRRASARRARAPCASPAPAPSP